ncbi:MAG: ATP-binding protein [bacterium]
MNSPPPASFRSWMSRRAAPPASGDVQGDGPTRAALHLPALAPLYGPAGIARRWVAYALDLALSLIFTFGWAAGALLFVFLLDTLFDLEVWGLLRYGQNAALTFALFAGLFALPYTGYFVLPLHRTGKTAGFFFTQLRMTRQEERLPPGIGGINLHRAVIAALPALLAGVIALSFLPQATDRPTAEGLLNTLRLPMGLALAFIIVTQFIDRLRRRETSLGIHERLARVRVVREPRLRELVEWERRVTEAHIAGGMAHEIRNALGAARLQLDRLSDPDISAQTQRSLEDILKSLTQSSKSTEDREGLKHAVAGVRRIYEDANLVKRALQEVSAAVDRGLGITRRVMDYSKIQPSGPDGADSSGLVAPVDPNRLVSELAQSYREALEREGIHLRLDLGATRAILANAAQCYSVFQNLLLNARDAIRENRKGTEPPAEATGTIRISTGNGDWAWVRFEDDGVGISTEHLERIFDPFYSTNPSQGMGLGLNECRRIVDLYGGEIQVESEAGRGTQFTVLWPAADEAPAPKAAGKRP